MKASERPPQTEAQRRLQGQYTSAIEYEFTQCLVESALQCCG